MVARGGTPQRLMLAARPGDQRRNLFHESGGTKFYSPTGPDTIWSCNCRGKGRDSGGHSAACRLRVLTVRLKGGGYARSEPATDRRSSSAAGSLPLVLGDSRRPAQRGARE